MLTAADIRSRVQQRPFTPFTIVTSSGETYDVTHPDLIMVGRRDLHIGIATPDEPEFYDRIARVGILHVTALRDLPLPSSPSSNGTP